MIKGGTDGFATKAGDATGGALKTYFDGARPSGYQPMRKTGAVILGVGGDNTKAANRGTQGVGVPGLSVGTFYEGVLTAGATTDAADAAVHADIIAAGYGRLHQKSNVHNSDTSTSNGSSNDNSSSGSNSSNTLTGVAGPPPPPDPYVYTFDEVKYHVTESAAAVFPMHDIHVVNGTLYPEGGDISLHSANGTFPDTEIHFGPSVSTIYLVHERNISATLADGNGNGKVFKGRAILIDSPLAHPPCYMLQQMIWYVPNASSHGLPYPPVAGFLVIGPNPCGTKQCC